MDNTLNEENVIGPCNPVVLTRRSSEPKQSPSLRFTTTTTTYHHQLVKKVSLARMTPSELESYRAESSVAEPRLSICSTSGMVYESVAVVGHMYGTDNVVYYLLEVRSWEMPLEGYVVRRRYNDFKRFHAALEQHMPLMLGVRSNSLLSDGFGGLYYTSLLCTPIGGRTKNPETSPLWSPPRMVHDANGHGRKQSYLSDDITTNQDESDNESRDSTSTIPVEAKPGLSYYTSNATLPLDEVKFTMSGRARLPPLPHGGISTFFSSRHLLIESRIHQFNKILAAAMSDPSPEVSTLLMNFIQEHPGVQGTYTSLAEYAALEIPITVERYARRRAMSMGKKMQRDQSSQDGSEE